MNLDRVRSVARCVGALGGLLTLFAAQRAEAWNADEHAHVAEVAFEMACIEALTVPRDADGETRPAHVLAYLCARTGLPEVYGQWNALAEDHVDDPELASHKAGGWTALHASFWLDRELHEANHFSPRAQEIWKAHHAAAVEAARAAATAPSWAEAVPLLDVALWEEAYAAHFLADAFSASHMAFNRAATQPNTSAQLARKLGRRGLSLQARDGASWDAQGDGQLFAGANRANLERVQRALSASLAEVTRAATGQAAKSDLTAVMLVPELYRERSAADARSAWRPVRTLAPRRDARLTLTGGLMLTGVMGEKQADCAGPSLTAATSTGGYFGAQLGLGVDVCGSRSSSMLHGEE